MIMRTHTVLFIVSFLFFILFHTPALTQSTPIITPTDGLSLTASCTFKTDHYTLPNGLVIENQRDLVIDFKKSILEGNFTASFPHNVSSGITIVNSHNITLSGSGFIKDYYYAIVIRDSTEIRITDMNLNRNWRNNAALWRVDEYQINPNVRSDDFGKDFTSLGGGVFMYNTNNSHITECNMQQQNSGINLFSSHGNYFYRNFVGRNSAFGLQMRDSTHNKVHKNDASNCNSIKFEDTAGIVALDSHENEFVANQVHKCGRGIAQLPASSGVPLLGNRYIKNVAFSNLVAFDADSCKACIYEGNMAGFNKLDGFQLKNSQGVTVRDNYIANNARFGLFIVNADSWIVESNNVTRNYETGVMIQQSSNLNMTENLFQENFDASLRLESVREAYIYNNAFRVSKNHASTHNCDGVRFNVNKEARVNVVGGKNVQGNYWDTYLGMDTNADDIGNTDIPFTNGGKITDGGDCGPLVLPNRQPEEDEE